MLMGTAIIWEISHNNNPTLKVQGIWCTILIKSVCGCLIKGYMLQSTIAGGKANVPQPLYELVYLTNRF